MPEGKPAIRQRQPAAVYFLALGSFAIGTEGFMVSGLLPIIAKDLSISIPVAGQLVTVFALAYAVSSPVLAMLLAPFDRRRLLVGALSLFAMLNFAACATGGFWSLLGMRVLLAVAAGIYMPNANALAGSLVPPERRGRALATVHGGITVALAVGVPFGSLIGAWLGWRATFACIGTVAALVAFGMARGLPASFAGQTTVASLSQRLAVASQPQVLGALALTLLWATGIWTIYPYLSLLLADGAGIRGSATSVVLLLYGVCAALGVFISSRAIDRFGHHKVMLTGVGVLMLAYLSLSVSAHHLPLAAGAPAIVAAVAVWGVAGFTFNPAQQARLIEAAGQAVAPVSLSLNAAFVYLGFALGALLGSTVIAFASVRDVGWVGALCELIALGVLLLSRPVTGGRMPVPAPAADAPRG
jgi:predicted MFS family arabinose efflux permease